MKKVIFILLLCIPLLGISQNKKIKPRTQIGYIFGPGKNPLGLNYFKFKNRLGWYVDFRPYWTKLGYNDWTGVADHSGLYGAWGDPIDKYATIINFGLSTPLKSGGQGFFMGKNSVLLGYAGVGVAGISTVYPITCDWCGSSSNTVYSVNGNKTLLNFNFGIVLQTSYVLTYQLGFDNATKGVNLGIGFSFGGNNKEIEKKKNKETENKTKTIKKEEKIYNPPPEL